MSVRQIKIVKQFCGQRFIRKLGKYASETDRLIYENDVTDKNGFKNKLLWGIDQIYFVPKLISQI